MSDYLLPETLVNKAREVVEANRAAGRRVAIAESCTGGLVSAALTEISGSSDVFEAGYVTYSNAAKISELKVSSEVVDTFGAVSVATAWAMARGALAASEADVAVAITGIAGPGGGTPSKPVGTVVFARAERDADPAKIVADQKFFDENSLGRAPSGGALRTRAVDAVERCGALFERCRHAPQRTIEHRARKRFEKPRLEGEIDGKMDVRAAVGRAVEYPLIVEVFERALDIVDTNAVGAVLHDSAGETLLEGIEAHDEVGDRLLRARGTHAHGDNPGQEFIVARNVRHEVEKLLGRIG